VDLGEIDAPSEVEIDPAAKRIAVELPEGLKDLNRP